MTLNDEDLRRLYRAYINNRVAGGGKSCPSLEDLSIFFEPHARTGKKLKIVDHITNCSSCAKEFEFFISLQKFQSRIVQGAQQIFLAESPPITAPTPFHAFGSFWRFSSVAVGALLVAASLITMIQGWRLSSSERAAFLSLSLVQPSQNHPGSIPLIFQWKEVRGAENYILELYDEALLPVWKSPGISAPNLKLPEDISRLLQLNRPYFWMVTAYRNKGKIAESELMRFFVVIKGH
jgi:hypothetical protein